MHLKRVYYDVKAFAHLLEASLLLIYVCCDDKGAEVPCSIQSRRETCLSR